MPVTYDISEVKDFKKVSPGLVETLMFTSLIIGMNSITEKNWEKFFLRVHMFERVNGAMSATSKGEMYMTPEHIKRMIGMKTNASVLTDAEFRKKLANNLKENAERDLRSFKNK